MAIKIMRALSIPFIAKMCLMLQLWFFLSTSPVMAQVQLGEDTEYSPGLGIFGKSYAMSSNGLRMVVGEPNKEDDTFSGQVRVLEWTGGDWKQLGPAIIGEPHTDQPNWLILADHFGWSVSLSSNGHRVAIGAPYNDGRGTAAGHVRVYELNAGVWTQLGTDLDGEYSGDQSGWSVSLSSDGNRVAVGAPFSGEGSGFYQGQVKVYEWNPEVNGRRWVRLGAAIEGEAMGDNFGYDLALSGDGNRIVVGSPGANGLEFQSGRLDVFEWDGNEWAPLGMPLIGESSWGKLGCSVAISEDGSTIVSHTNGMIEAHALDNGAWRQLGDKIPGFSASLSGDGNTLAISSTVGEENVDQFIWRVQIYKLESETWTQFGEDILGEENQDFYRVTSLNSTGSRVGVASSIGYQRPGEISWDIHKVQVFDLSKNFEPSTGLNLTSGFPNPSESKAQFRLFLSTEEVVEVALFDSHGRLVKVLHNGPVAANTFETFTIDLTGLISGRYYLTARGESSRSTKSIVFIK